MKNDVKCTPKAGLKLITQRMDLGTQGQGHPNAQAFCFFYVEDGLKLMRPVALNLQGLGIEEQKQAVFSALVKEGLAKKGDTLSAADGVFLLASKKGAWVMRGRAEARPVMQQDLVDDNWHDLAPR